MARRLRDSIGLACVVVVCHLFNLCTARTLPPEFQGTNNNAIVLMKMHFCTCQESLFSGDGSVKPICWYLCNSPMKTNCGNNTGTSFPSCQEPGSQYRHCGYADAVVCRYNDDSGSCVYSNSSTLGPFCICKNSSGQFPSTPSATSTCSPAGGTSESGITLSDSNSPSPTSVKPTADHHEPAETTTEAEDSNSPSPTSVKPTTDHHEPAETATEAEDGSRPASPGGSHRPTGPASPSPTTDERLGRASNASTVVLGVVLAVVLLVLLVLVVVILWRRGKFQDGCGEPRKPGESRAIVMDAQGTSGQTQPKPPRYVHAPGDPAAEDLDHTYSNVRDPDQAVQNGGHTAEGAAAEAFYHTLDSDPSLRAPDESRSYTPLQTPSAQPADVSYQTLRQPAQPNTSQDRRAPPGGRPKVVPYASTDIVPSDPLAAISSGSSTSPTAAAYDRLGGGAQKAPPEGAPSDVASYDVLNFNGNHQTREL